MLKFDLLEYEGKQIMIRVQTHPHTHKAHRAQTTSLIWNINLPFVQILPRNPQSLAI